ncbi:PBSX family phage terminase large subunit [Schleiferilactobacillus shenzhenensis]|nr:PBSX family phage terminase large subunit [Schleiferilactobacillus shenzhenensis]
MMQLAMTDMFTPKQLQVLDSQHDDSWFLRICDGAVRSGKTYVDNVTFLLELMRVKEIANKEKVKEPQYILAGTSSGTIQTNILQELSNDFGIEFSFDRHNSFKLFGVKVIQCFTGNIAGLRQVRGMTAYGAYVNEATLANHEVFQEIIDRCSKPGARIICDTNPDQPKHWLKTDYIDKDNDSIIRFHFTIEDNTFLPQSYIDHLKETTPTGMFYDRAIRGLWVANEGMVYSNFDAETMEITQTEFRRRTEHQMLTYYCGVDWGYQHKGVILLVAEAPDGTRYQLFDRTAQFKEIDYWVSVAREIAAKYGRNIPFYCDSARPEHVARFRREGFNAINGYKNRQDGIENVAKAYSSNKLYIVKEGDNAFSDEVYSYVWDEKTGEPVKVNDDVMDAQRYAIATRIKLLQLPHNASYEAQAAMLRKYGL